MKNSKALMSLLLIIGVVGTSLIGGCSAFVPSQATPMIRRPSFQSQIMKDKPVLVRGNGLSADIIIEKNSLASSELTMSSSPSSFDGDEDGWNISVPFVVAWVGFITFAFGFAPGGVSGEASQELLNQILANPVHPEGVNEVFMFIFALFTFIPISLSCLLMPGAATGEQKLPATPFLFASSFVGYFALGPYMATRKEVTDVAQSDLGWFTANVLENKLVNWAVVGLALSSLVSTGVVSGLMRDFQGELDGFGHLFSTTAFASASSVDICLLTLSAASLIPEDLKRRGVTDMTKANIIAASTVLLPVIGSTIYCALRPPLPEEK